MFKNAYFGKAYKTMETPELNKALEQPTPVLTEKQIKEAKRLEEGNESTLRKLAMAINILSIVLLVISVIVGCVMVGFALYKDPGEFYFGKFYLFVTPILPVLLLFLSLRTTAYFLFVFCDNAKNLREMNQK